MLINKYDENEIASKIFSRRQIKNGSGDIITVQKVPDY